MKKLCVWLVVVAALMMGCGGPPAPQMTQLQVRELQTRIFETSDTKMVMKVMLDVLQDDGFIIKNVDSNLGLLTADKDVNVENKFNAFMSAFSSGSQARWNKYAVVEVSANVSDYGEKTKVRANFQEKVFDNFGAVSSVQAIMDEDYYQQFFSTVSKGIFLGEENL